jgi:hypothetical protein
MINSVEMIYILPPPVKALEMLVHPSGKFLQIYYHAGDIDINRQ